MKVLNRNLLVYSILIWCHPLCTAANCGNKEWCCIMVSLYCNIVLPFVCKYLNWFLTELLYQRFICTSYLPYACYVQVSCTSHPFSFHCLNNVGLKVYCSSQFPWYLRPPAVHAAAFSMVWPLACSLQNSQSHFTCSKNMYSSQ